MAVIEILLLRHARFINILYLACYITLLGPFCEFQTLLYNFTSLKMVLPLVLLVKGGLCCSRLKTGPLIKTSKGTHSLREGRGVISTYKNIVLQLAAWWYFLLPASTSLDYALNLSILVSAGKEIKRDSLSSCERSGKSPTLNPRVRVILWSVGNEGRTSCEVDWTYLKWWAREGKSPVNRWNEGPVLQASRVIWKHNLKMGDRDPLRLNIQA